MIVVALSDNSSSTSPTVVVLSLLAACADVGVLSLTVAHADVGLLVIFLGLCTLVSRSRGSSTCPNSGG